MRNALSDLWGDSINARMRSGKGSRRGILYKYTTFGTL